MSLFRALDISGSALTAQRLRAEVTAANLANAETTSTPEGGPFRRKHVVFAGERPPLAGGLRNAEVRARGVQVQQVLEDRSQPQRRYEPGHPQADAEGYVAFPAIDPVEEMVNLMSAVRAYQLNVTAVQASKNLIMQSLEIVR